MNESLLFRASGVAVYHRQVFSAPGEVAASGSVGTDFFRENASSDDGFLVVHPAVVTALLINDEARGDFVRFHIQSVDTAGPSLSIDSDQIRAFRLSRIRSESGQHRSGRVKIAVDCTRDGVIAMVYMFKMDRDAYYDFANLFRTATSASSI